MADAFVDLSEEEEEALFAEELAEKEKEEEEDEETIPAPEVLQLGSGFVDFSPEETVQMVNEDLGTTEELPALTVDTSDANFVDGFLSLSDSAVDHPAVLAEADIQEQGSDTDFFDDVVIVIQDIGRITDLVVDELAEADVGSAIGYGFAKGALYLSDFDDKASAQIRDFFGQEKDETESTSREKTEAYVRMATSNMKAVEEADNYETENIAESVFYNLSRIAAVMPALVATRNPALLIGVATAADLVVFDAAEPRIANMFEEDLEGPLRDILLHDPNDSFYINKLRQALEAFVLNATLAGAGTVARKIVKDVKVVVDRRQLAATITAEKDLVNRAARVVFEPEAEALFPIKYAMTIEARGLANEKIANMLPRATDELGVIDDLTTELNVYLAMRGVPTADREAIVKAATRRFKAASKKTKKERAEMVPGEGDALKVEGVYDASVSKAGELLKVTPRMVRDFLDRAITDTSGPVKSALSKLGQYGEKARQNFEVMAGATSLAKSTSRRYRKAVYGGLHRGERAELDKLLLYSNMTMLLSKLRVVSTREVMKLRENLSDIDKALLKTMTKNEKEITQADITAGIQAVKARLGPERATIILDRQKVFEGAMKTELRKLREAGLIDDIQLEKLSKFQHTPMRLLDSGDDGIDPLVKIQQGDKTITVTSSGLKPITSGMKSLIHTDSQLLMEQIVARVAGRIARNKANQSLIRLADEVDGNGLVARTTKELPGITTTKLTAMVNGKPQVVYMDAYYSTQWIAAEMRGLSEAKAVFSVISGASLMRMMATGISPAFALVQIPRDLQHAWLVSSAWSVSPPKAIVQMGTDIKHVITDAITRSNRYQDYVEEGGMFSFAMRHGASANETGVIGAIADHGFGSVAVTRGARKIKHAVDGATDVLGYLGATSEIMTRLAVRERVIQKLMKAEGLIYDPKVKPPKAISEIATAEARALIDFSQGGWLTKSVDSIAPYLNVSVQALRVVIRSGIKNPKRLAAAVTGIWAGSASLYLYNRNVHPECWASITDRDKANNFIICTGATVQQDGETRRVYVTIPKDPTVRVLSSVIEGLLGKWFDDENPNDQFFEALKGLGSIFGDAWGLLPPTGRTILEYTQNKSFFTDKALWPHDPMHDPALEIMQKPSRPTSPMAHDVAIALGLSPARLEGSIDSLLPRNPWRDAVVAAYTAATRGEATYDFTEAMKVGGVAPFVAASPIAGKFAKLTYPGANELEDVPDIVGPELDKIQVDNMELDKMVADMLDPEEGTSYRRAESKLRRYLRSIDDPAIQKRLGNRAKNTIVLDRVFKRLGGKPGSRKQEKKDKIPPRRWWLRLMGQPPSARAKLFMSQYNAINDASAKRLMDLINWQLNVNSDTYGHYLRQEKDRR